MRTRQRRGGPDSRDVLEEGNDVLPPDLRGEVLDFFFGYMEGVASLAPLDDFARKYAHGELKGLRYGVEDGAPFDEARPLASS